jgi:hypothetical protein
MHTITDSLQSSHKVTDSCDIFGEKSGFQTFNLMPTVFWFITPTKSACL